MVSSPSLDGESSVRELFLHGRRLQVTKFRRGSHLGGLRRIETLGRKMQVCVCVFFRKAWIPLLPVIPGEKVHTDTFLLLHACSALEPLKKKGFENESLGIKTSSLKESIVAAVSSMSTSPFAEFTFGAMSRSAPKLAS